MKKKPRIAFIALFVAFSALVCAAALRAPADSSYTGTDAGQELAEYYLRDCEGYIAVYKGASSTPLDITEIETSTLNDTDIALLRDGIPVESRNELLLLLEDLGS